MVLLALFNNHPLAIHNSFTIYWTFQDSAESWTFTTEKYRNIILFATLITTHPDNWTWWQVSQHLPLFQFAVCCGSWIWDQCTAVNTKLLFTICKELLETFYFCLQRHVISRKHVHCMTKSYKLRKPVQND